MGDGGVRWLWVAADRGGRVQWMRVAADGKGGRSRWMCVDCGREAGGLGLEIFFSF